MNAPCFFYFYVLFLKNQNISSTFLQRKTLPVIQLLKTCVSPLKLINIKNVYNVCPVSKINCFQRKNLHTDTNQSTLNKMIKGTTLRYLNFDVKQLAEYFWLTKN